MYKGFKFMTLMPMEEFIDMAQTMKLYVQLLNLRDFMDRHKPC
jgi:hypothetical protein